MIEFLQSVLALIVTLSILVTFHELGHYCVARLCNVHVLKFSVGFGKPLFSKRGKPPEFVPPPADQEIKTRTNEPLEGTEFAIAAIPLGGYVKMLDEREGFVADDQLHLAFNRKPVWQRIAIVIAGPMANFLLAILAYWALFTVGITGLAPTLAELDPDSPAAIAGLSGGQQIIAVDDKATVSWAEVNMQLFTRLGDTGTVTFTTVAPGYSSNTVYEVTVTDWLSDQEQPNPAAALGLKVKRPDPAAAIDKIEPGSPADKAGFQSGDKIISIDGQTIRYWSEMVAAIQAKPDQDLTILIERGGLRFVIEVAPASIIVDDKEVGRLGVGPLLSDGWRDDFLVTVRYPFYSAWIPAAVETWDLTVFTFESIGKLVSGSISPKNISGPITIAQVASDTAKSGLESFVRFIALVSISLGVLNLLPIPVLDGGHLLYYLVELIFRRPVPEKVQVWGLQLGLFMIGSLMVLAFYNDLMRLWA